MSKIYKALEKAEEERQGKQDLLSISTLADMEVEPNGPAALPMPTEEICLQKPLVSLVQPGCLVNEQFHKLRAYLLRINTAENLKTILVTSSNQGEGKSFISANLAIGISHDLHSHALLVECDLRNPTLAQWFGISGGKGLSDYLRGKADIPEILLRTEVQKLSLIPAGNVENRPAELLAGGRMMALVRELRSRYSDRIIILDSTPLLATTEPEVLAKMVDGILVVVKAGSTKRETVAQAVRSLDKEKIIGVVLNDIALKTSALHARYFGSNGYYYRYGYNDRKVKPKNGWRKIFRRKEPAGKK